MLLQFFDQIKRAFNVCSILLGLFGLQDPKLLVHQDLWAIRKEAGWNSGPFGKHVFHGGG